MTPLDKEGPHGGEKPRYPGIRVTANGTLTGSLTTETRITDAGIFYPITSSIEGGELYQQAYAEGKSYRLPATPSPLK